MVFNGAGEREAGLAEAATEMLSAFDALLRAAAAAAGEPSAASAGTAGGAAAAAAAAGAAPSLAVLLQRYDEAWVAYLEQFVAWKLADAAGLESELVRMAVELEASKLSKVAPDGSSRAASLRMRSEADVAALVEAVATDQALIADRVKRLTGAQGLARLDAALAAARAAAAAEWAAAAAAAAEGDGGGAQQAGPGGEAESGVGAGAVDVAAALAARPNLPLAWQLLYDPRWRLPVAGLDAAWTDALGETDPMAEPALAAAHYGSEEEAAAAVQARVRRIGERAFWDSLAERLGGGGGAGGAAEEAARQVAALLVDLGAQLAEVLPAEGAAAAELLRRLDADALLRTLLPGEGQQRQQQQQQQGQQAMALDAAALFDLLDWSARTLRDLGAPAREAAAAAAHEAVRAQLAAAGDGAGAARAAARALRLLAVQLKQLRVDLANARLQALAARLTGSEGVR